MFHVLPAVRSTRRPSRWVRPFLLVGVVGALVVALLGPVPQASAAKRKDTWKPRTGAFFNQPRSTPANENRLENEIIAAVAKTPRGAYIKMAMFSYDRWPVTDALLAARKRGVNVQVVLNGHELTPAAGKLKSALGPRTKWVKRKVKVKRPDGTVRIKRKKVKVAKRNFFYQCVSACRGDGDVQHSKFILFDRTGAAKNVVMIGSLNMKVNGTHNQFNDLVVMNNRPKMYTTMAKVFDEMRADKVLRNPYRNFLYTPDSQIFVMPFARKYATKKTKWTEARDPITRMLKPVKCLGANVPSGRTAIRVNMHAWDGERGAMIARQLRSLYAKGCDVKLMVGFMGGNVQRIMAQPTGRGVVPVRSTGFDTDEDEIIDLYSHTKYLTINGRYGNKNGVRMIVTGSSNFQNGGQYGDELFLRLNGPRIHTQYVVNFNDLWANHTHGFSWSNTGAPRAMMGRSMAGAATGPTEFADHLRAPDWRDE